MPDPVKIMAILTARPGKLEALRALLDGMVAPSRAEPGNLRWDIWREKGDDGRFALDELYADQAAAAAHRETPHFRHYADAIGELAERTPLTLDPIAVARP